MTITTVQSLVEYFNNLIPLNKNAKDLVLAKFGALQLVFVHLYYRDIVSNIIHIYFSKFERTGKHAFFCQANNL